MLFWEVRLESYRRLMGLDPPHLLQHLDQSLKNIPQVDLVGDVHYRGGRTRGIDVADLVRKSGQCLLGGRLRGSRPGGGIVMNLGDLVMNYWSNWIDLQSRPPIVKIKLTTL